MKRERKEEEEQCDDSGFLKDCSTPSTTKKYKEDRFIGSKKTARAGRKIEEGQPSYSNYLSEGVFGDESESSSIRDFTLAKSFTKRESEGKKLRLRTLRNDDIKPFRKYVVVGWKDNYYTNLLDWSSDNFICAGFGTELYMYNMTIDDEFESSLYRKYPIAMSGEFLTSLKCSPMGTQVALGYSNGSLKLYDYVKEKAIYNGYHHLLRIAALDWVGDSIITGSKDQFMKMFDPRQKRNIDISYRIEHMHTQEVCGIKQKGNLICSGGNDNKVFIYDVRAQNILGEYSHNAAVKAISWVTNKTVVTGGGTADKKLKFWSTGKGLHKEIDTGSQVCNLAWSAETNQLISCQGFSLNQIILWSKRGERLFTFHGHSTRVLYSAMSPNGEFLASGAGDQSLKVWKLFPYRAKESVLTKSQGLR